MTFLKKITSILCLLLLTPIINAGKDCEQLKAVRAEFSSPSNLPQLCQELTFWSEVEQSELKGYKTGFGSKPGDPYSLRELIEVLSELYSAQTTRRTGI
jgi:hypothetical protein